MYAVHAIHVAHADHAVDVQEQDIEHVQEQYIEDARDKWGIVALEICITQL